MLLLDEKPYGKISISDITKKAGIARQTFYRNYHNKDDIVSEYLMNTFNLELLKGDSRRHGDRQSKVVLTFNLEYMVENRDNIKKMLAIVDTEHRIRNEAKEFQLSLLAQYKGRLSAKEYLICRYKLNYQLVGCLQVFFDWFSNDMPLPQDTMLYLLNAMNTPKSIRYPNIPNIVVRLQSV